MNKYFILLWIMTSSFALAEAADKKASRNGNVIISGDIVNKTGKSAKVITAIDCNPWNDGSSRHTVKIDSTGHFNTYVNIPYGHNFTIYYDGTFLCQYAEPGDSLYLTINASNLESGAHYAGSHAKFNNEYGKTYAELFGISSVELPAGQMPKDEYMDHFKKVYSGIEEKLNHYADSTGIDEDSKDLMKRSLFFGLANSALSHRDESPEKVLEFFEDPIFGLDSVDNLKEMMFPYHLSAYVMRLGAVVKPASIMQMIDAIVDRHPKSLNRDVMLALCMGKADEDDYPMLSRKLFADSGIYESIYPQQTDNSSLPDAELQADKIYEYKNGAISRSNHTDLTMLLTEEFKGKVVYLDLWATWCGPCREANKSLPEVAEFFKDEDVVFVSVAMKSDFNKWKNLVSDHPDNCIDYFIPDDDDAELIMSKFEMNGFPTYRLIGKDSTMMKQQPPRPNNPKIYDSLLEQIHKP